MALRFRSALVAGGILAVGLAGATVVSTLAAGPAAPGIASADAGTLPPNKIQVSAGGDVYVAPDMATVTFGVLINRDNAADAQAAANTVIANAVHNLHALGIPDRQIQTANISLQPRYDNSGNNIIGYQASQTLSVQVYSLHLAGPVVDAGVNAHANNNVSISYGLRDENAARTQALTLAVQNARSRAQAVAAALGHSLAGARVQISETSQSVPQPIFAAVPLRASAADHAPPTQSFGGTLTVHEDVTLTYTFYTSDQPSAISNQPADY